MVNNIAPEPNSEELEKFVRTFYLIIDESNRLNKAYEKFLDAKPNVNEAFQNVDRHFNEMMRLLKKTSFQKTLDYFFQQANSSSNTQSINQLLSSSSVEFLQDEAYLIQSIQHSNKTFYDVISLLEPSLIRSFLRSNKKFVNANDFYTKIENAHRNAIIKINDSRQKSRKKKKKQKLQVAEGLFGIIGGTCTLIVNIVTTSTATIACLASLAVGGHMIIRGSNVIENSGK